MSTSRMQSLANGDGLATEQERRHIGATELRRARKLAALRVEELAQAGIPLAESIAILSHELRNALAPIANALIVLRMAENVDSAVREKAQAVIERQVVNLTHLVDDLQELSSVGPRRVGFRQGRIDLREVVQRSVDAVMSAYSGHSHKVSLTVPAEPVWLAADAIRMEQVAVNLLGNAAKYTQNGGRIDVRVECTSDRAELRVADSGIGIAPDMLPRVFDLYARADTCDEESEGLGIGLNVVKSIVTQHGGSVAVRSAGLGAGSEFVVSLPLELPSS